MKVRILFTFIFFLSITAIQAQDAEPVNDDELKRYAVMMDSIDAMRDNLLEEISEMVKNNEKISVSRYNDLVKIIDDETKLAEASATPEEIAAIKEVQAKKEAGTAQINDAFRSLAKDYVGASSYNKVKKALKDPEVNSKYKAILAELKEGEATGG